MKAKFDNAVLAIASKAVSTRGPHICMQHMHMQPKPLTDHVTKHACCRAQQHRWALRGSTCVCNRRSPLQDRTHMQRAHKHSQKALCWH